jgi:hypothetical protein
MFVFAVVVVSMGIIGSVVVVRVGVLVFTMIA